MAYDKIARQRERRAEQRAAKKALQAPVQTLQAATPSGLTRGDVYAAEVAKLRQRNYQAENQFVIVQTVQPASPSDTLTATGPRQIGQYDPPTRRHRWNNSEHDIITRLMEVAANQEKRIRVLEAAEAERQMTAKPELSKLGLGAALGLLGFGLFMWATHTKPQA
jgi:hypothetical protein